MAPDERLAEALLAGDDGLSLRNWAKQLLDAGHPKTDVMDRIVDERERLMAAGDWRDSDEEGFLGVMDAMTGWCHPSAWLCPPD